MNLLSIPYAVLDHFFPKLCPNCRRELSGEDLLCEKCYTSICRMDAPCCECCGGKIDTIFDICSKCVKEEDYRWDQAVCVFDMNASLHNILLNFKYKKGIELADFLIKEAAEALNKKNIRTDLITSIPLHPLKFLIRGYNQSSIIAKGISEYLNIPFRKLLVRKRYTKTQTSLSGSERRKNLRNVFLTNKRAIIENKDILLVDDIFTTGSTLRTAVKALLESGAGRIIILVLARR